MFAARQSHLRSLTTCPRRTILELQNPPDLITGYTEDSADGGTFGHIVSIDALARCRANGETQMSTYDIEELMYAKYAECDIVLSPETFQKIKWCLFNFVRYQWDPRRLMTLEVPYEMEIVCEDGVTRLFTGRPDITYAIPKDRVTGVGPAVGIADLKFGQAKPRSPRNPPLEGEPIEGREYLSPRGVAQLLMYGTLLLTSHPTAQFAILRELHLRSGEERRATMTREELPQAVRQIGIQMMKLERAIAADEDSPLRKPRPGRHCLKACSVTSSCPVPAEQRGLGAVESDEDADEQFARFVTIDALRTQLRDRLKARYEETGYVARSPDHLELRWKRNPSGGRSFGVCHADDPDGAIPAASAREAGVSADD